MKTGTLSIEDNINALASAGSTGMAENYQQVKQRTQQALYTIRDNAVQYHQKNILAISSNTATQIMTSDLTNNPDKNKPLPNSAVVKMVYQQGKITVTELSSM